ncbi:hypothetical protein SAMN06265365_102252 [Tistlia consotensis]|uniref:Lipocalin-like domain-containing protein n=1 Tax=Tistlia consotensis USBA 355 TaxID=560819 RepID=A0A1Y6BEQ1_9PROT|nr:hypothetical protein [Tistlia consotensis]SMF07458.1 hypothetical protein SAMN05428998_10464 [Tistlia consotensis USBA 355]SNR35880.1 hypothetical protein SAMN06265365_102252 [Tistlia consotensis]
MIRLSLLLVALGVAALVVAQIASRPPPPAFQAADLVGSWVLGGADKCGAGETPTLTVGADGRATIQTQAYSASGHLLATTGVRVQLFHSRVFTSLPLLDDQGTRWTFVVGTNDTLSVLEGAFDYSQKATGEFMVLPRLPPIYRCG